MVDPQQAVIIASLQHRRQSLVALLRSMPEVGDIYDCETIDQLGNIPNLHPSLIIFDCWLDDTITLKQIDPTHLLFPDAFYLVLMKQNSTALNLSFADATLIEGFSMHQFFQTIRDLFNDHKQCLTNC